MELFEQLQNRDQQLPNGSVTGSPAGVGVDTLLWNVLYATELQLYLTEGCRAVAYADNLALISRTEGCSDAQSKRGSRKNRWLIVRYQKKLLKFCYWHKYSRCLTNDLRLLIFERLRLLLIPWSCRCEYAIYYDVPFPFLFNLRDSSYINFMLLSVDPYY